MALKRYIVKPGDSLSIIARDQLDDLSRWRELAYMNSIEAPYVIQPGQIIMLPGDELVRLTVTAPPVNGAAATKRAAFEFTPAVLVILGIAAVAVFMLMQDQR